MSFPPATQRPVKPAPDSPASGAGDSRRKLIQAAASQIRSLLASIEENLPLLRAAIPEEAEESSILGRVEEDFQVLCQIADQDRSLQLDIIGYLPTTAENCTSISAGAPYFQAAGEMSVIDAPTLDHATNLSWVDVANAFVWLIVVFLIEIEIRIQSADRFGSRAL